MKRKEYTYVAYEKTNLERLGKLIEDERYLIENDNVNDLMKQLLIKFGIHISRRAIFKSIKYNEPIFDKFFIYKIKKN